MDLTRRQEEFVRSLLDLYGELQEPFHYSELADRLGVSRFTAYDMLRVLEEKGIVTSHYQLDEGRSGPGRSTVVYRPTHRARRILEDVFAGSAGESAARPLRRRRAGPRNAGAHPAGRTGNAALLHRGHDRGGSQPAAALGKADFAEAGA